jgi:hypothetical protein
MTKILVLAGKKQSGKSTATNFVVGYSITQLGRQGAPYLPIRFTIDDETGELIIGPPNNPALTEQPLGEHTLNLYDTDPEVQLWLHDCVFPNVKLYAFADMLKATASSVFGIPDEWVNGTNEDKNKETHIKWKNFASFLAPKVVAQLKKNGKYEKNMTVREFLQYFGTNVCRKIYDDCWVESCFRRIEIDQPEIAIISDCRFKNEVKAAKKHGAKLVKLSRAPHAGDTHASEVDLDNMHHNNFDLVIGKDVTIREQNQELLEAMYKWGWFEQHVGLENEDG